ncbi:MAG: hypothetical protein Q8N23_18430 [Archangium sp.]|nr:hypothetical protein [Archangium sp.]MDP3154662.1 hypothetical protein [Archangium sp.]MDP3572710.1 hypothetical protein [Archangium sp.]
MAISKVNTSQVRTAPPSAAPAKAPTALQAEKTAPTGWALGANKGNGLKITHASIGDGPQLSTKVSVPKGYTAELKNVVQKASDTVHGKAASIEQDATTLTLTGPGGKKFSIGEGADSLKQTASEWRTEVDAAKKAPKEEWMQLDWSSSSGVSGAGTAGKLFSVSQGGSFYTGGAHPSNGSAISTFDARTGQQVKLDSLLSPKQMNDLVNDISARLNKMKGPDDIGPEAFGAGGEKAALRDTINNNFALSTDKNGKVKIDIAWESGVHALSGLMAHFSIEAPTDAAFLKNIGLD